jgi:Na+/melibiose symporter-like transporter
MIVGTQTAGAPRYVARRTTDVGAGVWVYFATLTLANALGDPVGLLSLPLQFTLKDDLGLGPQRLALFEVLLFIPVYFGFALGFLRDRWRPFGWGDRGYLLVGSFVAIGCYLWLAASEVVYAPLLGALFLAMVAYQLVDVASDALLTTVAQRHFMTGRLSAVVEGMEALPGIIAVIAGGWMAAHASLRVPLLAAAVCSIVILLHAFRYPREVFEGDTNARKPREDHRSAIARLWGHGPLRGAVVVGAVWNLSVGWGTPYLFYLTDELGLSSEVLGLCRAASLACAVIIAPVYSVLCQRLALKHNLRMAIAFSLGPGFLFLLVSGPSDAIAVSVLVGLPTAFGHIALFDLLRRACPRDLEGTAITLSYSALAVAAGAGDLIGAWLYTHGGFAACLIADAVANAAVLPMLPRLPADLLSRRDGEGELVVSYQG